MGPMWASFRLAVLLLCLIAGRAFVVQPSARSRLAPSSTRAGWTRSSVSTVTGQGPASQGRVKSIVLMSSPGAAAGAKTGTKVLVKERVAEKVEVEAKQEIKAEEEWRVILHNDEIHTFDYVTQSITKVVKKVTMKKAYEVTMETHKAGKATVTQAWKSKAEGYCLGLQQCGLTASIAPDSKFQGGKGEGGGEGGGDVEGA